MEIDDDSGPQHVKTFVKFNNIISEAHLALVASFCWRKLVVGILKTVTHFVFVFFLLMVVILLIALIANLLFT